MQLAKEMGAAPAEIIFVGDSDVDIQTARNAGMFPEGTSWGFRRADELKKAGAQIVLPPPMGLIKLL